MLREQKRESSMIHEVHIYLDLYIVHERACVVLAPVLHHMYCFDTYVVCKTAGFLVERRSLV